MLAFLPSHSEIHYNPAAFTHFSISSGACGTSKPAAKSHINSLFGVQYMENYFLGLPLANFSRNRRDCDGKRQGIFVSSVSEGCCDQSLLHASGEQVTRSVDPLNKPSTNSLSSRRTVTLRKGTSHPFDLSSSSHLLSSFIPHGFRKA